MNVGSPERRDGLLNHRGFGFHIISPTFQEVLGIHRLGTQKFDDILMCSRSAKVSGIFAAANLKDFEGPGSGSHVCRLCRCLWQDPDAAALLMAMGWKNHFVVLPMFCQCFARWACDHNVLCSEKS